MPDAPPVKPLPEDFFLHEVADPDDVPVGVVLDGTLEPDDVPALIERLQDFHLRALSGAPSGLPSVPQGRVRPGDIHPVFSRHPDVDGWLVLGRAEMLPPGALVRVRRRKEEPALVQVTDWVAARAIAHQDGRRRLWVMARFEYAMEDGQAGEVGAT